MVPKTCPLHPMKHIRFSSIGFVDSPCTRAGSKLADAVIARKPVTSISFSRDRPCRFGAGGGTTSKYRMISVISLHDGFTDIRSQHGRSYSICLEIRARARAPHSGGTRHLRQHL